MVTKAIDTYKLNERDAKMGAHVAKEEVSLLNKQLSKLQMELSYKFTTQNEGDYYSLIVGPLENTEANNLVLSFISKGYKKTEFILE